LASSAKRQQASEAGVHPIVVKTAIAAAPWFIAVVWLAFGRVGGQRPSRDRDAVLRCSQREDLRWPSRASHLCEFLDSEIGIASGKMSGRDVLIETALIPLSLTFVATLIGLAWVIFG
jgi:hypothetical protein